MRGEKTWLPLVYVGIGIGIGFLLQPAPSPDRKASPATNMSPQTAPSLPVRSISGGEPVSALAEIQRWSGDSAHGPEVLAWIGELELGECPDAFNALSRVRTEERGLYLDALARRWARLDPAGAFTVALAERTNNDWRNRLGHAAGAALAATDPTLGLDKISNALRRWDREKAAEWILPELAKRQPQRAGEYLKSNKLLARHPHIFRSVAQEYGRVAPREAIAWAESLPDTVRSGSGSKESWRQWVVTAAWVGWAEVDPASAAKEIQSRGIGVHAEVYGMIASSLSARDPLQAIDWAKSLTNESDRSSALHSVQLDFRTLGPDGAREILTSDLPVNARREWAENLVQQALRDDPQRAFAWAQDLPEGEIQAAALGRVLDHFAANEPKSAVMLIAALPESGNPRPQLLEAVSNWAEGDPEAALAFVEQLPPGETRSAALARAVRATREENPEKALEWINRVEDPVARAEIAVELIGDLVKTDSSLALQLAGDLPAGHQPEVYARLIRNWAFDNQSAAGDWINSLPEGAGRDAAIHAYVSVIDGQDPALATQWAYAISEPTERFESLLKSFHRWMKTDKPAASAWAESIELPEGFRPFVDRLLQDEKFARGFGD